MNEKGFHLTLEALISLLLLISFLSIINSNNNVSFDEYYLLEKQNHLFKVWLISNNFSEEELISDLFFVFPGNCKVLLINSMKVFDDCESENTLFSVLFYFSEGKLNKIELGTGY